MDSRPPLAETHARVAETEREDTILAAVAAAAGDERRVDWPAEIKCADAAIAREKLAARTSAFAKMRTQKKLERLRSIYDLRCT